MPVTHYIEDPLRISLELEHKLGESSGDIVEDSQYLYKAFFPTTPISSSNVAHPSFSGISCYAYAKVVGKKVGNAG